MKLTQNEPTRAGAGPSKVDGLSDADNLRLIGRVSSKVWKLANSGPVSFDQFIAQYARLNRRYAALRALRAFAESLRRYY